jgi:hypothetical protein
VAFKEEFDQENTAANKLDLPTMRAENAKSIAYGNVAAGDLAMTDEASCARVIEAQEAAIEAAKAELLGLEATVDDLQANVNRRQQRSPTVCASKPPPFVNVLILVVRITLLAERQAEAQKSAAALTQSESSLAKQQHFYSAAVPALREMGGFEATSPDPSTLLVAFSPDM